MHLTEQIFMCIHSIAGGISLTLNSVLLICMFRNTPSSFANFGVMMKAHVIVELYMTIGGLLGMTRTIQIEASIANIYYGPCTLTSPLICYFCYLVLVTGSICTFYIILGSFYFRLLVIKNAVPSLKNTLLILFGISTPMPTALMIGYSFSTVSQDVAEAYSLYPSYASEHLTISGTKHVSAILMISNFTIICVLTGPVYCVTLFLRRKILVIIEETASSMSKKSIRLQRNFVHMLTAQSALPMLLIVGASTFLLGFFEIVHHPIQEMNTCLMTETTSCFSPLIVFIFVEHFRLEVFSLFGNKSAMVISIGSSKKSVVSASMNG